MNRIVLTSSLGLLTAILLWPSLAMGDVTSRCATGWARDLRMSLHRRVPLVAGADGPTALALTRPPAGMTAETTHFVVHYNESGLADYADSLGSFLELGWRGIVDTLGYTAPPSDGVAGGDGRIDVYIVDPGVIPLNGIGVTVPEDSIPATVGLNDFTSYCMIVDTLTYSDLKSTAVHEFFHTVHFGYDGQEDIWFFEMISTWAEERFADDSNYYYRYMADAFGQPFKGLTSHVYANVIWAIYQEETFGEDVLIETLEECVSPWGGNALAATDSALSRHGSSLRDAFLEYSTWNLFTGAWDDGAHYPEGVFYPTVWKELESGCSPVVDRLEEESLVRFSNGYVVFEQDGSDRPLAVEFLGQFTGIWGLQIVRFFTAGGYSVEEVTLSGVTGSALIADWSLLDRVAVVVTCLGVQSGGGSQDYLLSVTHPPKAPAATPYVFLFDRDDCLLPFDGAGDDFGPLDGTDEAWARSLDSLGVNYLVGDVLPASLQGCSALFLLGGYDSLGVNLVDSELDTLISFLDRGGDIYWEARRPVGVFSSGGAKGQAFLGYFQVSASAGSSMAFGNVQSLAGTGSGTPFTGLSWDYDYQDPPDDQLETLLPEAGSDALCEDQSGGTRVAGHRSGSRITVLSTVLLGGINEGLVADRADFVWAVLTYMENPVGIVAVSAFRAVTLETGFRIEWSVNGFVSGSYRVGVRPVAEELEDIEFDWFASGSLDGRSRYEAFYVLGGYPRRAYEFLVEVLTPESGSKRFGPYRADIPGGEPLALRSIAPNPFNPRTEIVFDLGVESSLVMSIFDSAGRPVDRIDLGTLPPGRHSRTWPEAGSALASGVYFLHLAGDDSYVTAKLVLLQ